MLPMSPDQKLTLNIPQGAGSTTLAPKATPSSPTTQTPPTRGTSAESRRSALSLPGFAPKAPSESPSGALRAFTAPNTQAGTLKVPTQASRAQSASQVAKFTGPSPAATFTDLAAATPGAAGAQAHVETAKALGIVITSGEEGLKTVFGYDDKGHVAFGSHDELEMSVKKSTQHQNLLQRVGNSLKTDKTQDASIRTFGGELFRATMGTGALKPKNINIGGTRLRQTDDDTLQFTVSAALHFRNVTPQVLEPVARFHANVLRLAGMDHKTIKGDGDATDALAQRVTELLTAS